MHALIIEDQALIAMAIEDALRSCGFTSFDFACSVEAAVAAAHLDFPDLITADVRLSPGCGLDAIDAIFAERTVPVIFVTGTAADVQERFPGHVIVHKPFNAAHIANAARLLTSPRDQKGEACSAQE